MKTIEDIAPIGDAKIHYRLQGEGAPLMLICGQGQDVNVFDDALIGPLAERFQVLTFDHRWVGKSTAPEPPTVLKDMVDDAAELMDHLGWDKAHVQGESMGGMIAQELALSYPEKVDRLVLASTYCGGPEAIQAAPEVFAVLAMSPEEITPEVLVDKFILELSFPQAFREANPERMAEMRAQWMQSPPTLELVMMQNALIQQWGDFDRLGSLRQPTLILAGDADIIVPPENSRLLNDRIPDSRLVIVPGVGHGLGAQVPERLAEEMLAFLA